MLELSPREFEFIQKRYWVGKDYWELASEFRIQRDKIFDYEKRILAKIRKTIEANHKENPQDEHC